MNWKPGVLCRPSLPGRAEPISQGQTADPLGCPNLQTKSKNLSLPLQTKTKTKTQSSRVNTLQLEIKTSQVWVKSSTGNVDASVAYEFSSLKHVENVRFPEECQADKECLQILFHSCKVDLRMWCNDISDPAEVCTQASKTSTTPAFWQDSQRSHPVLVVGHSNYQKICMSTRYLSFKGICISSVSHKTTRNG